MKLLKKLKRKLKIFLFSRGIHKKIKAKGDIINVAFICQCQFIFNKLTFLADVLSKNPKFKVVFYLVKDPNDKSKDNVFINFAKERNIECYFYESTKLKELNPFYVIYPRPYNVWLPKDVQSIAVSKYANTCYIPYGYSLMELGNVNLDQAFTCSIKHIFADMDYAYDYVISTRGKDIKKGLQYVHNLGCPYLEELSYSINSISKEKSAFNGISNGGLKVIWTPRWTTDEEVGGSNFFRYIDDIFNKLVNSKDYSFVFRPHPYAFKNYVENGMMTAQKRDEYLSLLANSNNSAYDNADVYLPTFSDSDALITDVSSIIVEYLMTAKPIIFCHNSGKEILNDKMKEMCNVFYNAYSIDDILKVIDDLKNGIDPLKEQREAYVKSFIESQKGASERMISVYTEFFEKSKK